MISEQLAAEKRVEHFAIMTNWKAGLSLTWSFSSVPKSERTQNEEEGLWWLDCVILPGKSSLDVLEHCHGSRSQHRLEVMAHSHL